VSGSATLTVTAATDTTAPSAPTQLKATVTSSSQVELTWIAAIDDVGVTEYRLERCTGNGCGDYVEVATVVGTSYGDSGLSANTTYRYRVRAGDAAGNLSPYSNVVNAKTAR
jgi:chitodextrinase